MPDEIDGDGARDGRVVLVFGATGRQGGAVANALTTRSRSVRAVVRNPGSAAAQALAARGVEVVRGDFADAPSMRAAMAGADGVFSVQPNSGSDGSGLTDADEVRFGKLVADLAVEAGVNHLVYSSASIIGKGPTGVANLDCKCEIEDHVRNLPIAATIIRPATFMELLPLPSFWLARDVLSFFASPHQAIELIAADDIGRIAALIFADRDRFAGRTINIAGDEITGADMATAIGKAMGRSISYRRLPDAMLEDQPSLKRTVQLFDEGRAAGNADIAALDRRFGELTRFDAWLTGKGRALMQSMLSGQDRV